MPDKPDRSLDQRMAQLEARVENLESEMARARAQLSLARSMRTQLDQMQEAVVLAFPNSVDISTGGQ